MNFLDRFAKNTQIPNFNKIRPLRAKLFHVYGQTHMAKLIVAFRNSANASKNDQAMAGRNGLLQLSVTGKCSKRGTKRFAHVAVHRKALQQPSDRVKYIQLALNSLQ
jgi:hypothetical protein